MGNHLSGVTSVAIETLCKTSCKTSAIVGLSVCLPPAAAQALNSAVELRRYPALGMMTDAPATPRRTSAVICHLSFPVANGGANRAVHNGDS